MRINELSWMGAQAWPPQWSNSGHAVNEAAVLNDVKLIVGTGLLRIDVVHRGIPHLGLMLVDKEVQGSLYRKLKENVGRCLAEIANLEIELEQGVTNRPFHSAKGRVALAKIKLCLMKIIN